MRRFSDQPEGIGDILNTLASRMKKVDLRIIDEIRNLWPSVVGEVLATRCRPELVKNGVLLISVPSGAFAQRILEDQDVILAGLAALGERAPVSLRPLIESSF
jgi:predicted nucleic acid-binding Zn ribbon protein